MSITRTEADEVERHPCPTCKVEPGSSCRTRSGKVAPRYHTPRFAQVPRLAKTLAVETPADRRPGLLWTPGEPVTPPTAPVDVTAAPVRLGYARCSTVSQELQGQLDELEKAHCKKVFSEKISTRIKDRPQLAQALSLAKQIREATHGPVILTVTEMKRLGRDADELTSLARTLQEYDVALEMLRGPLPGIYNPSGSGSLLFAFFAAMAEAEREGIREATLEGLESARNQGKYGGRRPVLTEDDVYLALKWQSEGTSVPEIAKKLVIKEGKHKGEHPSVASVYRALAKAKEGSA